MTEEVFPTEIRFSRELDRVRAVSLGLAILMALAIFTLQGPIMAAAGPAAALSYLLIGGVFLLNLLCYVELQLSSGKEGGAYILLREATRVPWAFLAGWSIMLSGVLLCAALALGFAAHLAAFADAYLLVQLPEPLVAALLVLAIAIYNALGGRGFRGMHNLVTWSVMVVLLLLCLLCLPHIRLERFRPFSPQGVSGVEAGLSLLLIGFLAFESVSLAVSEIRRPRRTIPRAFFAILSLGTILSSF